jgi:hypothetical protein
MSDARFREIGVGGELRSANVEQRDYLTSVAAGGGAMVRAEALALLASTARVCVIHRS